MDANDFRRIALGCSDAIESAHMGHPDFRVNGRIFATLHHNHKQGMVVLPLNEQQRFVQEHPSVFAPESGAWGRQGCTRVQLASVDEETLGEALTVAWQNAVNKRAAGRSTTTRRPPGTRRSPRRR